MQSPHRASTRRALFEAALDQFSHHGYASITHADIAVAAGIGRTTFYEYFASKDDLLVQLVEDQLPELTGRVLDSIDPGLPAEQRLAELIARMIEFVATDHLGLLLHTEVPRLPDDAQRRIGAAHAGLSRAFVDIYRDGVAAGRLRAISPELAARLLYEVIMTAGRTLMATADPKQHVHETADEVVSFVLDGLDLNAAGR